MVSNSYYLFHLSFSFVYHLKNMHSIWCYPIPLGCRGRWLLTQRLNQLALILFLSLDLLRRILLFLFIHLSDLNLQGFYHLFVIFANNFHRKLIDWLRLFYINQVVEWIYGYIKNQIILNTSYHKKLLEQGFDKGWKFLHVKNLGLKCSTFFTR